LPVEVRFKKAGSNGKVNKGQGESKKWFEGNSYE
jgi:hypothetical protein